jgi:hypothetical protein
MLPYVSMKSSSESNFLGSSRLRRALQKVEEAESQSLLSTTEAKRYKEATEAACNALETRPKYEDKGPLPRRKDTVVRQGQSPT